MNVLQVISGRDVNGALVYCRLLSQRLAGRGHKIVLLCRKGSWIAGRPPDGVELIESDLDWFPPRELKKTARLVRERGIDLVHSHMSRAHNFAVLLRSFVRVPVVATAHARLFQLHWRFHDLVLANSAATADWLLRRRLVSPARLRTVLCFAELDRFFRTPADRSRWTRGELGARDGRFLIGAVGELAVRKGHRYLMEALPAIIQAIPDARLVLLGRFHRADHVSRSLRRFQLRNGLARRVHWLGRRDNVQDYLAAMNVCVVPSVEEPLGLVAVEAQAAGIPVIATRVGGLPEIVEHEKTGLLVPARDPEAIANAVIRLRQDAALGQRLVAAGKESARATFDPERLTGEVERAYESLLAARPLNR